MFTVKNSRSIEKYKEERKIAPNLSSRDTVNILKNIRLDISLCIYVIICLEQAKMKAKFSQVLFGVLGNAHRTYRVCSILPD